VPQPILVKRVLRSMPGSAGALLALCDNEIPYVIKCANSFQGPNVLANEFIGSALMEALALPTARWQYARYSSSADCPFNQSGCDLHFASELLRPSSDGRLYSFLPSTFVPRVENRPDFIGALVFDIWAGSSDVRQPVYVEDTESRTFKAVFIDNGHLFGGPYWEFALRPGTALCLDLSVYTDLIAPGLIETWIARIETTVPPILSGLLSSVPCQWYKGDTVRLQDTLLSRAESLRDLFGKEIMSLKGVHSSSFRGIYGTSPYDQILSGGVE
jgi:hypothetical protein